MKSYKTQIIAGSAIAGTLLMAGTAFAATSTPHWGPSMGHIQGGTRPGVMGKVTAINGSTLTISGMSRGSRMQNSNTATASSVTYSVDASAATVMKAGATSTVASIAVGDNVMVQGTVSGTNITATVIRDGMPAGMHPGQGGSQGGMMNFKGNGQPVIGGTVSAISGSTLTVTNTNNAAYSVDDTGATVIKQGATSTASNIATGDRVVVQGTVNGTSVTASSIIDSGSMPTNPSNTTGTSAQTPAPQKGGFFGAIGGFFHKLFGFF